MHGELPPKNTPHLRTAMAHCDKKKRGEGAEGDEDLESRWEKRRTQLFDQAVDIHGRATGGQSRLDLPNRGRPWGGKSSRRWKTPSVILSFKNKSLPLNFPVTISDLKCREIFTQANHPFQRHLTGFPTDPPADNGG